MSFLVDTDTCSANLKANRAVSNRFLQYTGGIFISAITLGELYTWVMRAGASATRRQSLQDLLKDIIVLEFSRDVAFKFGELRAVLFDKGLPAPPMDLLIASTALVHNFTLVTHNTQDFINIPGLRLADWMLP